MITEPSLDRKHASLQRTNKRKSICVKGAERLSPPPLVQLPIDQHKSRPIEDHNETTSDVDVNRSRSSLLSSGSYTGSIYSSACSTSSSTSTPSSSCSSSSTSFSSTSSFQIPTFGLVNEGCTCYLNALLQLLYHTGYFRRAVFQIPSTHSSVRQTDGAGRLPNEVHPKNRYVSPTYPKAGKGFHATNNSSLVPPTVHRAMQELFYLMQVRSSPNRTQRLTDAFGWGSEDLMVQHDIQEMAALLRDRLEERMRGTTAEGAINRLFEGKGVQIVQTTDGSFTSRHPDVFYDIHLPIIRYSDLYSSLVSLTAEEKLEGENKYLVEEDGKPNMYKDAVKTYRFLQFPPVIWFHLKRFTMDMSSPYLEMRKINSKFSFPPVLDLQSLEHLSEVDSEELNDITNEMEPKSIFPRSPAVYDLHGVIVHRGSVASGHYFCYIREWNEDQERFGQWIRYDDENVRAVNAEEAIQKNYGTADVLLGEEQDGNKKGSSPPRKAIPVNLYEDLAQGTTSAYIVAYVRRSIASKILAGPAEDDVSSELKLFVKRELEKDEARMRMEQERRESLTLRIITNRRLAEATASQMVSAFRLLTFTGDARQNNSHSTWGSGSVEGDNIAEYPADFALQVRKTDLLQTVYEVLAQHPQLQRSGRGVDDIRLWRWDPLSGACASSDPSWNAAACTPLPTHKECLHRTIPFTHFISSSELHQPVVMYLYLEEPSPFTRLLPAMCVQPLIKRFQCIEPGTYKISLRKPIHVGVLSLVLGARQRAGGPLGGGSNAGCIGGGNLCFSNNLSNSYPGSGDCGIEIFLLNTTTGQHIREPRTWYAMESDATVVHVPLRLAAVQGSANNGYGSPVSSVSGFPASVADAVTENRIPSIIDDIVITCVEYAAPTAGRSEAMSGGLILNHSTSSMGSTTPVRSVMVPSSASTPRIRHASGGALNDQKQTTSSAGATTNQTLVPLRVLDIHLQIAEIHLRHSVPLICVGNTSNDEDYGSVAGSLFGGWDGANGDTASIAADDMSSVSCIRPSTPGAFYSPIFAQLPNTGPDRILVFFKLFDSLTSTVRYLGSALLDRCCTLQACEPLLHRFLGYPWVERRGRQNQQLASFYVEEHTGGCRPLEADSDLWNSRLSSGSVVVVQYRNTPPVFRHTITPSYLQYVMNEVVVHVVRFRTETINNQESVARQLMELKNTIQLSKQRESQSSVFFNPYQTSIATLYPTMRHLVCRASCPMVQTWSYLLICDAAAAALRCDANRLVLYPHEGVSTSNSRVHEDEIFRQDGTLTVGVDPFPPGTELCLRDMLLQRPTGSPRVGGHNTPASSSILFAELLSSFRSPRPTVSLCLTLRDALGHAVHAREFSMDWYLPLDEAVSMLVGSVESWEFDIDTYETLSDTCNATHYLFVLVDMEHQLIARHAEVPMKAEVASMGTGMMCVCELLKGLPPFTKFAAYVQPCPPLRCGEMRVSCCHVDYSRRSAPGEGNPFVLTLPTTMSVAQGLKEVLQVTGIPLQAVYPPPHSVMMRCGRTWLSFRNWDDYISSFWAHTPNDSPYVANLGLNYRSGFKATGIGHSSTTIRGAATAQSEKNSTAPTVGSCSGNVASKKLVLPHT